MADNVKLPEGFTLDPAPRSSVPEGFTIDAPSEKGSYFSGAQGLVPDTFEDIGKGIYSGIVSVPQGIVELGALGVDAALDTNTSKTVTDAFEYIKPELGTAGEVTEDIVAFGAGFIPIAGWLGKAGQAAKAAKGGKALSTAGRGSFTKSAIDFGTSKTGQKALGTWAGLTGSTAAATLGYSTAVANDGRATLSDNFDVLPDALKTEADAGLTGRQEAARRFRNKLKVGVEDALLSGAFDTALKAGSVGFKAADEATGGAISAAGAKGARKVLDAPSKVTEGFMKGLESISPAAADRASQGGRLFREYFTASRGANEKMYETVQDARAVADTFEKQGLQAAEDWSRAAESFVKSAKLQNGTPVDAQKLESALHQYLLGNTKPLDAYNNPTLTKAADKMIDVRSELEQGLITQLEDVLLVKDPDTGKRMIDQATGRAILKDPETPAEQKAAQALNEMLKSQNQQNGYLRRMFTQYTDPVNFYKSLDLDSKEFNDAVQEVASHIVTGKGRAPNANDMLQAKNVVYESLGMQALGGLPPDLALKNVQDSIKRQMKGEKFGLIARERPVLSSIDDIFVARKEMLDVSPSLRKLKGELTDPLEVYTRTITDMAQANAAADMYAGIAPMGKDLVPAIESIAKGGRPALVNIPDPLSMSPEAYDAAMQPFRDRARDANIGKPYEEQISAEAVLDQYKQQLRDAGYVQLGDNPDIQHVFGGSYGELTGKFAAPETYGALTAPLKLGSGFLGEVTGILSNMRSLSQKMTIVPNPGAQIRNIVGNMGMLAANANLGRDTDFTDMFKIFTSSLDTLDEAGLDQLARKISLTGVADTSLVTRALKEYRKAGQDLSVSGKLANAIDLFEKKIPFMQTFEKIYSESDTFFKGLSLLGEEKKFRGALNAAGVSANDPYALQALFENGLMKRAAGETNLTRGLDNIEVMAGDIVKDTMPIYPRVGKAVRAVDMVPIFGNFTSFASENIRNSVNILNRGLKEMAFEVPPNIRAELGEQTANKLEQQVRAIGANRLMSYTAVATIIPQTMVRASMTATGTTPEQMDAMRLQLPDYMDGHDLVILGNDQKGKIDYIDLSYVSPYAFVLDPARAALQVYSEKGRLDKSEIEQIASGAWRGVEMFLEPFGSESMIFERLRDVLPSEGLFSLAVGRGGKTATGADVYAETDGLGEKFGESIGHIMNGIIPEYVRLAGTVKNPLTAEFEPGRVYRAATGTPGKRGEEYNMFKEGARLVTGFTPMTVDLRNDFAFKGLEYGPRRTDAKQQASRVIKRADATMEDMEAAWSKYLDNLYREQSKLYMDIQAAREMGLSDTEIRRNLVQGANMSRKEVNGIMAGKFYPTAATRELAKDVNAMRKAEGRTAVESRIPFGVFNRMSSARMNEPLALSEPTKEAPSLPGSQLPPGFQIDAPAPAPAPAPSALPPGFLLDEQTSLPQPTQTASTQVNPIVLGNDPATQALAKSLGRSP
jgi:hypothetical protein